MATWVPTPVFQGPVIRGEVGDTIIVHLRNNDKHYKQPHSLHPHGVRYAPESDGSWTAAYTKPGSAIPFGELHLQLQHLAVVAGHVDLPRPLGAVPDPGHRADLVPTGDGWHAGHGRRCDGGWVPSWG